MLKKLKLFALSLLKGIRENRYRAAMKLESAYAGEETFGQAVLAFLAMLAGVCVLFLVLAIATVQG